MKIRDIRIDSVKLEQGDWVDDIPSLGDIRLRVRGLGNDDYRRRQAELVNAVPRHLRKEPAEQDRITVRLILETILVDWANVEDDKGKVISYSRENAANLLSDPDLRAFADGVIWAASAVSDRRKADLEQDAGN